MLVSAHPWLQRSSWYDRSDHAAEDRAGNGTYKDKNESADRTRQSPPNNPHDDHQSSAIRQSEV